MTLGLCVVFDCWCDGRRTTGHCCSGLRKTLGNLFPNSGNSSIVALYLVSIRVKHETRIRKYSLTQQNVKIKTYNHKLYT
jgi:hypothetical protein